jgi:hypothetical protein
VTVSEYFKAGGVSNSMLSRLEISPAHLKHYMESPEESTKAQEIGTFFHDLTLLADKPKDIAIKPKGMTFVTREGKEWRAMQEARGYMILTQDEYDSIYGMFNAVMANKRLRYAVETGAREQAYFAPFGGEGGSVMRKCRMDLVTTAASLLDFKTTTDPRKGPFSRTMFDYRYFRQAAYYLDIAKECGLPHTEFIFVACEKTKPYSVGVYHVDAETIQAGRKQYIELLELFMRCRDANEWPALPEEPQTIGLPHWAHRDLEAA